MFSKYYQSELAYLREMGRRSARPTPRRPGMLVERGGDPDVERLLEGFAFLTARIRERMDDAVPGDGARPDGAAAAALPARRCPPAPSWSSARSCARCAAARACRGRGGGAPSRWTAPRCVFRTTSDVDLLPLTLVETVLDQSSQPSPVLRVQFQVPSRAAREIFQAEGFALFIHAEPAVSATLLLWLMRLLPRHPGARRGRAASRSGCRREQPARVGLRTASIRCCPGPRGRPRATGCCRSTSRCRRSSSSSRCAGWRPPRASPASGSSWPSSSSGRRRCPRRVPKDIFRLHCAPVVNLFSTRGSHPRAARWSTSTCCAPPGWIPSTWRSTRWTRVTGLQAGRTERRDYRPFFDFAHTTGASRRALLPAAPRALAHQ